MLLACCTLTAPSAIAAQEASCPSLTYGDLAENPITGDHRGTEITITTGQKGCVVLVRVGEGRLRPTQVGVPFLAGDTIRFRLSDGPIFTGTVSQDTLRGQFDTPGAIQLSLPRRPGPSQTHEH
jgi:hypothetical protein